MKNAEASIETHALLSEAATADKLLALETGALGMQRDAGVPSVVASAIEAMAILLVVGAGAWSRWMPRRSVGARVSADGAA